MEEMDCFFWSAEISMDTEDSEPRLHNYTSRNTSIAVRLNTSRLAVSPTTATRMAVASRTAPSGYTGNANGGLSTRVVNAHPPATARSLPMHARWASWPYGYTMLSTPTVSFKPFYGWPATFTGAALKFVVPSPS